MRREKINEDYLIIQLRDPPMPTGCKEFVSDGLRPTRGRLHCLSICCPDISAECVVNCCHWHGKCHKTYNVEIGHIQMWPGLTVTTLLLDNHSESSHLQLSFSSCMAYATLGGSQIQGQPTTTCLDSPSTTGTTYTGQGTGKLGKDGNTL